MSNVQYAVRQDGMFVAKVDVMADEARAKAEALHYMAVYAQDGPVELWRRSSQRKWKPIYALPGSRFTPAKDPTQ